jgi:hypothetical protein
LDEEVTGGVCAGVGVRGRRGDAVFGDHVHQVADGVLSCGAGEGELAGGTLVVGAGLGQEGEVDRLHVGLGVETVDLGVRSVEPGLAGMPARCVDGELPGGGQQGVALPSVRRPGQAADVDSGRAHEALVVVEADRIPQLGNPPQLAFASVEVDDWLLPLVVVGAHGLAGVHDVAAVRVLGEIGGVRPVDVGHVPGGDVQRQAFPVLLPRHDLDPDVDARVLLRELLERRLVGRDGLLVPEAEGDGGLPAAPVLLGRRRACGQDEGGDGQSRSDCGRSP